MSEQDQTPHHDMVTALAAYETKLLEMMDQSVSLAEAKVLILIEANPLSMVAIAAERGVSKQAVQSQIQSLAKRGFVALMPNPQDARVRLVSLTQDGHATAVAYRAAQTQVEALVEDKLGPQRLKNFRNMLGQITAVLT